MNGQGPSETLNANLAAITSSDLRSMAMVNTLRERTINFADTISNLLPQIYNALQTNVLMQAYFTGLSFYKDRHIKGQFQV